MQLITYADRLGGDLSGLKSLLDNEFRGLFSGVHILPFFDPIDGADAGFDPIDHTKVDPRLGSWQDVEAIGCDYAVMADLIVNHVSAESAQFKDVRKKGPESDFWEMFLRKKDLFPESDSNTASDIARIYRPRPGLPFTSIPVGTGDAVDFWTTFSVNQLDINVETRAGQDYLRSILAHFGAAGVREIRLDAAGYAIKRRGTSCFMLPETFDFIASLSEQAADLGIDTLVEVHSHFRTQIEISRHVGRVYDFALPPLILHALYVNDAEPCKRWLSMSPRNCVTVLDTHDGIGILDVARAGHEEGLLANSELDSLVEGIHEKTSGASRRASGHAASNLDVYQVNTTYYDALGRDDRDYLIARAIQFFAPGTPQIYYVGALAGTNDVDLVERTGIGRDINRHYYSPEEIREAIATPVVDSLIRLIRLRNVGQAFAGEFSIPECEAGELRLRWDHRDAYAELSVSLRDRDARIDCRDAGIRRTYRVGHTLELVE